MPVHNLNMASVNPRDDLADALDAPLDVSGLAPQWNRKLQALSRDEYDKMREHVHRIIPPDLCDPDEALHEALLVANRKFRHDGSLEGYVVKVAWRYAHYQYRKYRRQVGFENIDNEFEFLKFQERVLPFLTDPRYVEVVDELFVQRIEQILYTMRDYRHRHTTSEAIRDARQILGVFRESANLGKGIGVDEYEDAPINCDRRRDPYRKRWGRRVHNQTIVRRQITQALVTALETTKKDVQSACQSLRLATTQALREGWLPGDPPQSENLCFQRRWIPG